MTLHFAHHELSLAHSQESLDRGGTGETKPAERPTSKHISCFILTTLTTSIQLIQPADAAHSASPPSRGFVTPRPKLKLRSEQHPLRHPTSIL